MRILVPFGNRKVVGLLLELAEHSQIEHSRLKCALEVLDEKPVFPAALMRMLDWASNYYQHPPGEIVATMLPARLRRTTAARSRTNTKPQNEFPAKRDASTINPNEEQRRAIAAVVEHLGRFACHLLDGVTGSGKTEVYLQLIEKILATKRQALVLVPEISLTPQTIALFRQRFSTPIAVLHSGLTDLERYNNWYKASQGQAGIVIGTRSAVFTPLARPGIIIVDEEHDLSFKQQDGFRYSARDLAIVRGREEKLPVVLGSATPALETLFNARSGKFSHLQLTQRTGSAGKPRLALEDISREPLSAGISNRLVALLEQTLAQGNQALIFINRRGFAPSLYCGDCGWVFECQACDAQLTVHKNPPLLRCHHCEAQHAIPVECPHCHGRKLLTRGVGTEKTEHFLQQHFDGFPIIRMDRDSTRRKDSLETILEQMAEGKPGILVGTQMLAKGHHFPKVTLVAILDADTGLFSPDFRGTEQMLQLLLQVAGRAGRADQAGRVVIQTRHPTHPLLQTLLQQDYPAQASLLLEDRKRNAMPPFSHLALFRAEDKDAELPATLLQEVRKLCLQSMSQGKLQAVTLLGPLPAPMEKRAGRFRMQLLLQSRNRSALQAMLAAVIPLVDEMKLARKLRWSLDVDPLDLI